MHFCSTWMTMHNANRKKFCFFSYKLVIFITSSILSFIVIVGIDMLHTTWIMNEKYQQIWHNRYRKHLSFLYYVIKLFILYFISLDYPIMSFWASTRFCIIKLIYNDRLCPTPFISKKELRNFHVQAWKMKYQWHKQVIRKLSVAQYLHFFNAIIWKNV